VRVNLPPLKGDEGLWGGAHDMVGLAGNALALEQVHIRARIHRAQNSIHLERTCVHLKLELLGEDNLEDITVVDVFLGASHHLEELTLVKSGMGKFLRGFGLLMECRGGGLSECFVHRIQPSNRALVLLDPNRPNRVRESDQHNL